MQQDHIRKMPTHSKQSQGASSVVIPTGVPNGEKVTREVCAQLILPKVTLVGRVTFPMQRVIGTYDVRLTS